MNKLELKNKLSIINSRYKKAGITQSMMKLSIEKYISDYLLTRKTWYYEIRNSFGHTRMMDEINNDKQFLLNLLENIFGKDTDIVRSIHKKKNGIRRGNKGR